MKNLNRGTCGFQERWATPYNRWFSARKPPLCRGCHPENAAQRENPTHEHVCGIPPNQSHLTE
jgi:hypothetical protein